MKLNNECEQPVTVTLTRVEWGCILAVLMNPVMIKIMAMGGRENSESYADLTHRFAVEAGLETDMVENMAALAGICDCDKCRATRQ